MRPDDIDFPCSDHFLIMYHHMNNWPGDRPEDRDKTFNEPYRTESPDRLRNDILLRLSGIENYLTKKQPPRRTKYD